VVPRHLGARSWELGAGSWEIEAWTLTLKLNPQLGNVKPGVLALAYTIAY